MSRRPTPPRRLTPALGAALAATALALAASAVSVAGQAHAATTLPSADSPALVSSDLSVTGRPGGWTGAWTSGQQRLVGTTFTDQTLRLLVHPTLGGSSIRIRLADTFGDADQTFDAVSVGIAASASGADLVPGTARTVRFDGTTSVTVLQGSRAVSDPVPLKVSYGQTLAVDLYVRTSSATALTGHASAGQGSFSASGNQAGAIAGTAFTGQLTSWYWLDGVDVRGSAAVRGSVIALGDSITDGAYAAWNGNRRWPDDLAARLQALPGGAPLGVLNEGIGGNRVIAYRGDCCGTSDSALARLDRDVIAQTGARTLFIADGINDIGYHADAASLIAGLHQLAVQAHAAGLRVVAATITPYGGGFDATQEATRQSVNAWIRTSHDLDGYAEFAHAVEDPAQPSQLLAAYDAGDHLHLNDAGYQKLADSISLRLLG